MAARLRLLTWNLGRLYLGTRLNRWLGLDTRAADGALGHVARVVAQSGVEAVAVQELRGAEQLERLRLHLEACTREAWDAAAPERDRGDRRVGLLARRALAPAFAAVKMRIGRAAQAAVLGADGARWTVAAVHLDAFDDRARAAQVGELLEWARAEARPSLVLAGDLNLDPAHPAAGALDGTTWRAVTATLRDLGVGAGTTAFGGRRLDYVLAHPGIAARVEVLRGRRVPLGDHDPLLAALELGPPRR